MPIFFLLGDFKINYLDKVSEDTKRLIDFETFTNWKQQIKDPTRNNNIIDLIYSNSSDISQSGVLNLGISDHELIFCTLKKACVRFNHVHYIGRSYRNYDKNRFVNCYGIMIGNPSITPLILIYVGTICIN